MTKEEYAEKLKDPRWQKKRLEIFERDKWTCVLCDATGKTLHVHHWEYSSGDPWEIDDALLNALCEDCHEEWSNIEQKMIPFWESAEGKTLNLIIYGCILKFKKTDMYPNNKKSFLNFFAKKLIKMNFGKESSDAENTVSQT